MILKDTRFDEHGVARLGENPGDSLGTDQVMELQRHIATNLFNLDMKTARYDLTIYVGDADLTFHGMSRDALRQLSVELERLSCAE